MKIFVNSSLHFQGGLPTCNKCQQTNLTKRREHNKIDYKTLLSRLETLEMSGNDITVLRYSDIAGLVNLISLNLANNEIMMIELGNFLNPPLHAQQESSSSNLQFAHIEILHLRSNRLKSLSDHAFTSMRSLECLILKQNQISTISSLAFEGLTELRQLDLSWNRLRVIDLSHIPSLASVQLLFNRHLNISSLHGLATGHPEIYQQKTCSFCASKQGEHGKANVSDSMMGDGRRLDMT